MSEGFRSDVREVIKSHELDPEDLRTLAADLETLADRWEDTEDII